jgi:hypoxanthine phosphoribosyltransferase
MKQAFDGGPRKRVVDEARGEHLRPKRFMSWEQYGQLERGLSKIIIKHLDKRCETVAMVFGIYRGGLVLARSLVSRLDDVPLVIVHPARSTPSRLSCLASEDVHEIPEARRATMIVLLVDDISDTGKTFIDMKRCLEALHFKHVYTAALVLKTCTTFVPDFLAENDPSQDWIVFPWEFSS